jgi:Rrf2 family protein
LNELPVTIRYAIKILIFLALSPCHPVSAAAVAKGTRVPPSQAAKILHTLRWGGLTRSRRGASGGYELHRKPEEIRVEQVVNLFVLPPDEEDSYAADEPLQQIWKKAETQSQRELMQLTIAELCRRMPAPAGEQDTRGRNPSF